MEGSDNSELGFDQGTSSMTPYYTPYQKAVLHKSGPQTVNMYLSPSSGGDGSVVSLKGSSGSPSSSSSDSESESINLSENRYQGLPMNTDSTGILQEIKLEEEFLGLEQQNQMAGEDCTDNMEWAKENRDYEELLRKFIKTEEELKDSNLKLQLSEKEVIKLKSQIENTEGQLAQVQKELTQREADLEYEKGQIKEFQKQMADLESHVPDCSYKIAKLEEELLIAREQLKVSDYEVARLRNELEDAHELQGQLEMAQQNIATLEDQLESGRKQIQELEENITWYKANETNFELEVQELKAEVLDAQIQFSSEKQLLHLEILSLSEAKNQLDSRLQEWESKSNLLKSKLQQCEAEKLKLEKLHVAQQMVLQGEVNCLKEELGERRHDIETLNKEFDRHKHKYDVLMTEKDGANAKIHKLMVEVSSRDNQIENMDRELCHLKVQQAELISGSESRLNLVNELKLKVAELEKEVARQKAVISERAEEKREAIRQLCFSLEYYRSGYQELREAFTGHKRHPLIAS